MLGLLSLTRFQRSLRTLQLTTTFPNLGRAVSALQLFHHQGILSSLILLWLFMLWEISLSLSLASLSPVMAGRLLYTLWRPTMCQRESFPQLSYLLPACGSWEPRMQMDFSQLDCLTACPLLSSEDYYFIFEAWMPQGESISSPALSQNLWLTSCKHFSEDLWESLWVGKNSFLGIPICHIYDGFPSLCQK